MIFGSVKLYLLYSSVNNILLITCGCVLIVEALLCIYWGYNEMKYLNESNDDSYDTSNHGISTLNLIFCCLFLVYFAVALINSYFVYLIQQSKEQALGETTTNQSYMIYQILTASTGTVSIILILYHVFASTSFSNSLKAFKA